MSDTKLAPLSGNALKILAAALMVCDHVGLLLFPKIKILRMIGRLAFPIFAYLIAEGAKHTKNRIRYLLTMAGFATVIQVGYYIFNQSLEMSVMVTFTLSLISIFTLDLLKKAIFDPKSSTAGIILNTCLFFSSIALAAVLDKAVDLDYNFSGCMLPLFPSLLNTPRVNDPPKIFESLDRKLPRLAATAMGILALSVDFGGIQYFSLLALPILLLYSEKRGRLKMKYFFYVFYPLHLVLLYGIAMLVK